GAALLAFVSGASRAAEVAAGGDDPWQVVDEYCVSCHNATDWAGGIALDVLDRARIHADSEAWEKVIRRMRGRLMPPPGEPRPASDRLDAFVAWIEDRIDADARPHAGYVQLH